MAAVEAAKSLDAQVTEALRAAQQGWPQKSVELADALADRLSRGLSETLMVPDPSGVFGGFAITPHGGDFQRRSYRVGDRNSGGIYALSERPEYFDHCPTPYRPVNAPRLWSPELDDAQPPARQPYSQPFWWEVGVAEVGSDRLSGKRSDLLESRALARKVLLENLGPFLRNVAKELAKRAEVSASQTRRIQAMETAARSALSLG
jgi:hypothetical protein